MANQTEIEAGDKRSSREEYHRQEQRRRERNLAWSFSAALAVGVMGVWIFAYAASGLPSAQSEKALAAPAEPSNTMTKLAPATATPFPQQPLRSTTSVPGANEISPTAQPVATATVPQAVGESASKSEPPSSCSPLASADTAKPEMMRILGLGLLAGGAAGLVGALVGFLFGLPRMPTWSRPNGPGQATTSGGVNNSEKPAGQAVGAAPGTQATGDTSANNNLIEISDWLAKIIVGAGLVGMKDLTRWVGTVGTALGTGAGLGCGYMAGAFGATVILYFFTLGFLFAYINTRTVISLILVSTDRSVADQLRGYMEEQDRRAQKVEERLGTVTAKVQEVKDNVTAVQENVDQRVDKLADENRIFALLYSTDPSAPRQVVKLATEFLQKPGNENNSKIWLYLACAYGQLHALAADEEKSALADEALKALTRAMAIEPQLRSIARGLLDKNDPNHFPGDDDLLTLGSDERFQKLVKEP